MNRKAPKLLVVAGNRLDPLLAEYALNVAVRLDLEIIVLFVRDSVWLNDGGHRSEVERFETEVESEVAEFSARALKMDVNVTIIVDVDNRESAITQVREHEPEIRFILSGAADGNEGGSTSGQHPRLMVIRPS